MRLDELSLHEPQLRLGHRTPDGVPLERRLGGLEPTTIGLSLGEQDLVLSQGTPVLLVVLHEQRAQQPERTVRLVHAHQPRSAVLSGPLRRGCDGADS